MSFIPQKGPTFTLAAPARWLEHNSRGRDRLGCAASNVWPAANKWAAIAQQQPQHCDEVGYEPGPPTRVFYKDRRTGRIREFKLTFQWLLVETNTRA